MRRYGIGPPRAFVRVEMATSRHLVCQQVCRGGGRRIATAVRVRTHRKALAMTRQAQGPEARADRTRSPEPGHLWEARSEDAEANARRGGSLRQCPDPRQEGREGETARPQKATGTRSEPNAAQGRSAGQAKELPAGNDGAWRLVPQPRLTHHGTLLGARLETAAGS